MAAKLKCSICPKQPTFSDESHLLTHVSSKGHLAHLHKLQVRSHQEVSAGHQLAAYDQWYQQHGLGRLLSDRMLQKEAKRAGKRNRSRPTKKQARSEITENSKIDPSLSSLPMTSIRHSSTFNSQLHRLQTIITPLRARNTPIPSDGETEYDSSPINGFRQRQLARSFAHHIKSSSSDGPLDLSDADCAGEDDLEALVTPDSSKLKGIIWPGMDLFDAATAEMRRRRNQKKDGKTIKQMEITSRIVEPTEVIYSPSGAMRKQRLITGMVDDSSPLRGETPLPKKQPRRRRAPLAETTGNVPRNARRPQKTTLTHGESNSRDLHTLSNQTFRHLSNSSTRPSQSIMSHFSPTADETMEFRLTVGQLHNRERAGNFTVFNDGDNNSQQRSMTVSEQSDAAQPRFPGVQNHTQPRHARSLHPFMTTGWLHPQHQQSIPHKYPYTACGPHSQIHMSYQHGVFGKENREASFGQSLESQERTNPLGGHFTANIPDAYHASTIPRLNSYQSLGAFASQDDPFGYSSNPLSAAYQQLHSPQRAPFMMSGSTQRRYNTKEDKRNFPSPDGTVSVQDGDEYTQVLFATTE